MPDGDGAGQADAAAANRPARAVLKKLRSPGLEKAPVIVNERLIGATSNAVDLGNRWYRKMRKTVYRARTQRAIEGRLAPEL